MKYEIMTSTVCCAWALRRGENKGTAREAMFPELSVSVDNQGFAPMAYKTRRIMK